MTCVPLSDLVHISIASIRTTFRSLLCKSYNCNFKMDAPTRIAVVNVFLR